MKRQQMIESRNMTIPVFHNKKLFEQVFTHRSYLNETPKVLESNERLEFLGDSVLSFVVSSSIYKHYKKIPEGDLTNIRSALTNAHTLYAIARNLGLGKLLYLSRGEEASGGRENKTILADTFEALVGGLFIDQGIEAARQFVEEAVLSHIDEIIQSQGLKDAKSKLQEKIQETHKVSPTYKIINEEGPDHAKTYTVGVYLNEKLLAEGAGHSKQEAEKAAAANALENIK